MDPILFWNDVALEANRVSFTGAVNEQPGPPLSARALAIIHLAMYDAFAKVSGNPAALPAYLTTLPAVPAGSTIEASVAAAAYTALVALFPSQKAFFDAKILANGNSQDAGHEFGVKVAKLILDDRKNDPRAESDGYTPSLGVGKHKVDPDNSTQGYHAPFYGERSKSFAVTSRHPLLPPPVVGNSDYTKAYKQVLGNGIAPELMGTVPAGINRRDFNETIVGIFWGYDGSKGLGTPPRLYNQIIRAIAAAQGNTPAENARLFALVNVAMADAGILAWDEKYRYEFWRPVVGIRESPVDPDTGWLPLGAPNNNKYDLEKKTTEKNFTPPFPAYPSGHATFGAAAFHIAELFYGVVRPGVDVAKNLHIVSDEFNGVNQDNKGAVRPRLERTFTGGFRQMIEENGFSRVNLGVHWSFDAFALKNNGTPDLTKNIGGVPLGTNIANDIFANNMQKSNV
jgi:Vanadium chloroperoxidase N-terminal domain/PAP2 superfamily